MIFLDSIMYKLHFLFLCIFASTLRTIDGQTCNQTLQKCQNCFPDPRSCDTKTSDTLADCLPLLSDPSVTVIAHNDNYPSGSRSCWSYDCQKSFKRSSQNSTTYRYGCDNGCNNITLTPYDDVKIMSVAQHDHPVSNYEECLTLAVESAFSGTPVNLWYSSGSCKLFTTCPAGGCNRVAGSWTDKVDVVACDALTACPSLVAPLNGAVHFTNGYNSGSVATYSCDPGYSLVNYNNKVCSATFVWTTPIVPTCEPAATTTTVSSVSTSTSSMTSSTSPPITTPKPVMKRLYIMSCLCYVNSTFQGLTEDEIIDQLVQDTKIDASATTLSQQKLQCTPDPRSSSKIIGTVGIIMISVIFGLFILVDCLSVYQKFFDSDRHR